jgi:flagellar biosynthesis/type III secretory pathway chaperone
MDGHALGELADLLSRECNASERLLALLAAERALLTGSDAEAVEAKSREKQALLDEFESLETRRHALLAASGAGPSREELESLCERVGEPHASRLRARFATLATLLKRCRSDNEVNGLVVTMRQRHVRQLLTLLRSGRTDDLTYARGGRAPLGTRALARA